MMFDSSDIESHRKMLNKIRSEWGSDMNPKHIVWLLNQAEEVLRLKMINKGLSESLEGLTQASLERERGRKNELCK